METWPYSGNGSDSSNWVEHCKAMEAIPGHINGMSETEMKKTCQHVNQLTTKTWEVVVKWHETCSKLYKVCWNVIFLLVRTTSRYKTSQIGQLNLAIFRGRDIE